MDLILELWWLTSDGLGILFFRTVETTTDITESCLASLTENEIDTVFFPFEKDRLILLCNAIIGLS
jgi:hypothetical protein